MTIQIQSNSRVFVTGKTGSGKTYWAITQLLGYGRIVFHDRKWENHNLIRTLHFTPAHTPEELIWLIQHNKKRILYQPNADGEEDFNTVCEIIYKTGNIAIMVDEVGSYTTGNRIPHWFSEILRLGRNRGIGVISLSQRPKEIPNTIISESEFIIMFRLQLKDDRRKLEGVVGEGAEYLRTIPPYYFLIWDGSELTPHAPVR